jgi:predicted RNase H-like nuclease (RuvC/YqgF family)
MSFMKAISLDEAIAHCLEVAEQNEDKADKYDRAEEWENAEAENCLQCATDHKQLAEWLKELKELRAINKKLEDENASLSSHACDLQLAYNNELVNGREAKRLLKLAVDDINSRGCIKSCQTCVNEKSYYCNCSNYKWKHTDETLKLIGEE